MNITRRRFFLQTGCGLTAAYGGNILTGRSARAAAAPMVHDNAALTAAKVAPEPFASTSPMGRSTITRA